MAQEQKFAPQGKQIANFLRSLTGTQKLWLAFAGLTVTTLLYVFVTMLAKPEMKPLYSGLQAQDAQALGSKLAAQKIEYQISPDGTSVSVAVDKLDSARLLVASDGGPKSGRMGFELFDKPNWGSSDFSEKVNYQRALEGELERTLSTIDGVEAVRVHLVLPRESLFADKREEAKASVILKLRGAMSPNSDVAIRRFLAGAVEGLRPEGVTVIDAENNLPIGKTSSDGSGVESERDQALAKELVRTLEPIVGVGGARASVHVEYDVTSGDETQETYDPNSTAALTMQKSEETVGGTLAQGVPGTASNIPNTQSPSKSTNSADSQSSKSESGTYAVNRVVRHTLLPAGRIKRITAALLVDDADVTDAMGNTSRAKRSPEELKKIDSLARASLGINDARGDVLAVENLSFHENKPEVLVPLTKLDKVARVGKQFSWTLRYALIALLFLIVYVVVLRPVRRQVVLSLKQLPSRPANDAVLNGNTGKVLPQGVESADPAVRQAATLKKQLIEKAKAEPASAGQLVQSWLREEEA
ncbi:flagellar M-ring protein FliF [Candidatus Koribacter versatilis Ellin345]|uniref:Flagellar M-ring protein n=1 Tax=Koribacter versatilis (strain Ellin345) TaxID=204669 RepID=Q1IR46_KORVE|nr:flagellar basal-body MS-ring/collar protein FliF [Candidatus Koribacter versatilis]ABF40654.1 flagellar M-ring protein FliF [Candidatus Koribacter versatilis Ellin345]